MKAVFIIPYYGKFPNYFELFLKTCENNPEYHWMIFSDIEHNLKLPHNVEYIKMTFDELREKFQCKIDFPISLDSPYKLCDYRPAYGLCLQEYIHEYDYWGYCDIDLLFGNLKHFIPYEKIKKYDKVGHLGHMALYRNNEEINTIFTSQIEGLYRYKEVFQTKKSCIFDEWNWISINHILRYKGKKIWFFDDFFDVYPYDNNFKRVFRTIPEGQESYGKDKIQKRRSFASIETGKAYQWSCEKGKWNKTEVAYVHFQKRKMQVLVKTDEEKILCIPNKFIPIEDDTIQKKYLVKSFLYGLFNIKRMSWNSKMVIYWLIEKSSPIRHPFRGKIDR